MIHDNFCFVRHKRGTYYLLYVLLHGLLICLVRSDLSLSVSLLCNGLQFQVNWDSVPSSFRDLMHFVL